MSTDASAAPGPDHPKTSRLRLISLASCRVALYAGLLGLLGMLGAAAGTRLFGRGPPFDGPPMYAMLCAALVLGFAWFANLAALATGLVAWLRDGAACPWVWVNALVVVATLGCAALGITA